MTVVFVHGIFSSCAVFGPLKMAIGTGCPGVRFLLDFTYDYLDSLEVNARKLNQFLHDHAPNGSDVAIVAHSMGGLVARMALLADCAARPYNVRYLVMMATPNHGAIKVNQLKGVVHQLRLDIGKLKLINYRAKGLDDLTRVNTIINDLLVQDPDAVGRTESVDYVTIPALRYHPEHPVDDEPPDGLTSRLLNFLAGMGIWDGPIRLALPHDGVVEEASVRMVTMAPLDQNERTYFSTPSGQALLSRRANLHVSHPDFRQANHVEVHSNARVCSLVPSLLNSRGIDDWVSGLGRRERSVLNLSNGELI